MKIYIAGPMTGYPGYNYAAFNRAEKRLQRAGHQTVNPTRHGLVDGWTWADYMRAGVRDVTSVDAVALLPGWEASRGAQLEVHVAHALGLSTIPIEEMARTTTHQEGPPA